MHIAKSLLLITFLLATAHTNPNNQSLRTAVYNGTNYDTFKKSVALNKNLLSKRPSKDIRNYLFKLIDEDIYNYWAGTPWAFSGTTQQPNEGTIACGYFVTTTLTDLGFKIDRIGLAEDASGVMIKKLCVGIKSFNSLAKLDGYLSKQPVNSVFIIGLDFHTGYVVKTTTGCYFFHSNYIKKEGVIKEKIDISRALANNKYFMIGSLSANTPLLRRWVEGKQLLCGVVINS